MKVAFMFCLVGLLIYGKSLTNGFVLDDEAQLVQNKLIQNLTNLPLLLTGGTFDTGGSGSFVGMYYRPMAAMIRAVTYSVFGRTPFPYHLTQVLLHVANTVLLYAMLRRFVKNALPFFLSLLFLVHPINTEAVVYVSALQDVLVLFFGMLACLFQMKKLQSSKKIVLVSILLLLSLLSKETGVFFVFIVLIYIQLFEKKRLQPVHGWYILTLGFYLFLRFGISKIALLGHWVAPISNASLAIRLATIPKEIFYYLKTLVFPLHLSFSQHFLVTNPTLADFFFPLMVITFIIVLYRMIWKNTKAFFFFSIWFLVSLGLHLNIIPLDMTVSDHWFYIPFVGLVGMIEAAWQGKARHGFLVFTVLLVLFSVRSFSRSLDWKDGYTLYTHDIQYSPNNFDLENNLASELVKRRQYNEALVHAQKSVALAPTFWVNWNTLGASYLGLGERDKAIAAYQQAIKNSDFYLAYENLAGIYLLYDTPQRAEAFIQKALLKFPRNGTLWFDLAIAQYQEQKREEALVSIQQSIRINPTQDAEEVLRRIQENLPLYLKSP